MSNREKKLAGREKARRYVRASRTFLHHVTSRKVKEIKRKVGQHEPRKGELEQ